MAAKKKARTSTDNFDPAALYAEWKPLAELKKPGFSWAGEDYEKARRSQGPDRDGLKLYAKALAGLLKVAPSCYPRHLPLRDTLLLMQGNHMILDPSVVVKPGWADKGADKWGIMMKHLLDESKLKKRTGHVAFDDLLDKVRELRAGAKGPDPSDKGPDPSDVSDVEIVSFTCACPECKKLEEDQHVGSSEAGDGDVESESSQAAAVQIPMNPAKGGHKLVISNAKEKKLPCEKNLKPNKTKDKTAAHSIPDGSLKQKVNMVERKKGKKECYIMVDGHFWVGVNEKQTTAYKQVVTDIKNALEQGLVTSKDDAIKMKTEELKKLGESAG
jgi:hypothetical protein